ncbi:ABC transporter [Gemmobacter lutimaris]|uniref:ABC transporter n=1 Tax=Gemmobacter lutimaris TaxID=2306023 RepID=A0A398BWV4_9RHOB|nr:ABC transporter substrate-binding protein [Gemmobacter lutimaris]RID92898.1 ABC transporter [Gemmobacter lutimaris]
MKKTVFTPVALALSAALAAGAASAEVESNDPIKITTHDWSGQIISATLMGEVLKKAGYNVEYVQADYLAQFAGLKTGDLDLAMEIWATTGQEALDEAVASGGVVNFGESGMKAKEEWWYPSYMEETCPGLPDWKALRDCAEAFSTAETAPKGRYLGGPVTWGGFDEERVEALEMDFEVVHAGTDAALFAELQSAYERKAPIVLWLYSPHWAPEKYEGKYVEFPPYESACYTDPAWGENPDAAYDCGKPTGPIWKAGWAGLEGKWPGAAKIIRAFHIENPEMGEMIYKVDVDGAEIPAVVAEWMGAHESVWQGWLK